jgi:TDG/mug DNA glycosylase family protein
MAVLRDVLTRDLDVVFCGTAAGNESARRKAYYAGPGNSFWATLFRVGLTPQQLEPEQYEHLQCFWLGLTDLAKHTSGSDRDLLASDFDCKGLRKKILKYHPRVLAFTSKRAAEEFLGREVGYGLLLDRIGDTALFVLPSPSGLAKRYWNERPWRELARLRDALADERAPNVALERDASTRLPLT